MRAADGSSSQSKSAAPLAFLRSVGRSDARVARKSGARITNPDGQAAIMIVNSGSLAAISTGFQTLYRKGFDSPTPIYRDVAMIAKSSGSDESYAWLGKMPSIREWVGSRIVHQLEVDGFRIVNRKFESTVEVMRTDIEDDKVGVYKPMFEDMGRRTAEFPDELLAELITANSTCYDGQNFFDADHPFREEVGGIETSVSNFEAGDGPTWYLLDLSRAVRPFIYQERVPFIMQRRDQESDANVFSLDALLYGVRGRCNVGYSLWQLAYASQAPLDEESFERARTAMIKRRGDGGKRLGVQVTHALVPTDLEGAARRLLKNPVGEVGASNTWAGSAELLVSPWL